MNRRDKRVVKEAGIYRVIEIEFINKKTAEIIDTGFEVRKKEKFLVEFDNEREALMQLEFLLKLERENRR